MGKTGSTIEVENRITQLVLKCAKGEHDSELKAFAKSEWGLSDRQVARYLKQTAEYHRKNSIRDVAEETGKAIEKFQKIYKAAFDAGDFRAATAAQKEINLLLGLYPSTKVEHSGKIDFVAACVSADAAFHAARQAQGDDNA